MKVKKQPTEWKKIFTNHVSDKDLKSRIYKEHLQFDKKKTINPLKNWTKDLNRLFSKEDIKIATPKKI